MTNRPTTDFPLTSAQLGVWLADGAGTGGHRRIAEYFDVPARVDTGLFRAAWRRVFRETDALRIRVLEGAAGPRQVVLDDLEPVVHIVDLSAEVDPAGAARRWMAADLARPAAPDDLFAVALFRLADEHFLWYQRCHHVALDGYGGALFATRVADVYNAEVAGEPLPPATFGALRDVVRAERDYLRSDRHAEDRAYWAERLAGTRTRVTLAADPSPGPGAEPSPAVLRRSAELAVVERDLVAANLGRALAPAVTAVFAAYVHRVTGLDDLLLGVPVTARRDPFARRTPAMLSNVIPLRVRVRRTASFAELVGEVSRDLRAGLRHQRYRLEELRRDLGIDASERGFPGPTVNVMPFPYALRIGGRPVTAHNLSNGTTDDLALAVHDRRDGTAPRLELDGNPDLYRAADLDTHLSGFLDLLAAAAREPGRRLSTLAPAAAPGGGLVVMTGGRGRRAERPASAPATERERVFTDLFTEVLALDAVGVDEAFFEVGGDSVTAIQLVARAREHGLVVSLRDVFGKQTPAELARVATSVPDLPDRAGGGSGPVPATPASRWLTGHAEHYRAFHQSVVVRAPTEVDEVRLRGALQALVDHHDLLRARLTGAADHPLVVVEPGALDAASVLRRVPVAHLADDARREEVAAQARAATDRLAAEDAALVHAVWFDAGDGPGLLLLVLHHLVVDGVSWRVLLRDLELLWADRVLPPPTTPFRRWAEHLAAGAGDPDRLRELDHWTGVLTPAGPPLGDRPLDRIRDLAVTGRRVEVVLTGDEAADLVDTVPAAFHAGVEEVLLSALAPALAERWSTLADPPEEVVVDVEGHGRGDAEDGPDLSRTVGWFTSVHPVRLPCGSPDRPGENVKRVKERLRSAPGASYGVLRHLNPDTGRVLARCAEPEVLFNYLGEVRVGEGRDWGVAPGYDLLADGRDPRMPFSHGLVVDAVACRLPGGVELRLSLRWPEGWLAEHAVEGIADRWRAGLRDVAAAVRAMAATTHTPADLSMPGLDQHEIDELEAELNEWV